MSLLRLAFWLALLVLLLPTDAQQQARFSNFANNAFERLTTFCDRNGTTCAVGSQVWATFLKKAEFGVRLVADLLGAGGRQLPPEATAPAPGSARDPARDRRPGRSDARGTLSPPDLYQPPWRGPVRP
jgi:hypothetical protein